MANVEDLYIGQKVLVLQFKDSSIIGGINYEAIFRVYQIYDDYISLIDEKTSDSLGRSFTEYMFKKEELENSVKILSQER